MLQEDLFRRHQTSALGSQTGSGAEVEAVCQHEWVCAGGLARSCAAAKRVSRWP